MRKIRYFSSISILYSPINTTLSVFCVWFLFDTTTCFGCPNQPSVGRALVLKNSKQRGLSVQAVDVIV